MLLLQLQQHITGVVKSSRLKARITTYTVLHDLSRLLCWTVVMNV